MADFFKTPNLPELRVKMLIMGECYAEKLKKPLAQYGVELLRCPPNPKVDPRLACHADLSVLHMGENRFILAKYLENTDFSAALRGMGGEIAFAESEQGRAYPADASLCALFACGRFYHNRRLSDGALLRLAEIRQVSQGYAKCAVCPVDGCAVITADSGMASALEADGASVLKLGGGQLELAGFSEGFIGGAAFKLSPTVLALTGRLKSAAETERVEEFLSQRGIKPVYLTDGAAFDIGSALPIC